MGLVIAVLGTFALSSSPQVVGEAYFKLPLFLGARRMLEAFGVYEIAISFILIMAVALSILFATAKEIARALS